MSLRKAVAKGSMEVAVGGLASLMRSLEKTRKACVVLGVSWREVWDRNRWYLLCRLVTVKIQIP